MKEFVILFWAVFCCVNVLAQEPRNKDFTDPRDNQTYPIVPLGNLYWFAANLNFNSPDSDCFEDETISCGEWGRVYPIEEFRDVCPEGWRLPNKIDWKLLEEIIRKEGVEALYDGTHWLNNQEASNSSGLSLVPSGFQHKKKFHLQYINSTIWFEDGQGGNWHFHTDGNNNKEPYYFHTHEDEVYVRKFAVRCVCQLDELD